LDIKLKNLRMFDLTKIIITPEILLLISEIDEFKGAWKLYGRMTHKQLNTLFELAKIESTGSAVRSEGSTLSNLDIEQLLSNLETHNSESKNEREIVGYARVYEEIAQKYGSIPFSEKCIKQFHDKLLNQPKKTASGHENNSNQSNNADTFRVPWKDLSVSFGNTRLLEAEPSFEISLELEKLITWTQEQLDQKKHHPLLIIGIFGAMFLNVCALEEANGHLYRMLTMFLLLKTGYNYVPYCSLERITEKNKEYYQLALELTQKNLQANVPNFDIWLIFFLKILQTQKRNIEGKISKDKTLNPHIPELDKQILNVIAAHEQLSIMGIEKLTGANRNTLKKHLASLVDLCYIVRFGKGRATWYTLS
jgi:Fic family protein